MSKKILVLTVLLSCGAPLFCTDATQPVAEHKSELVDVIDTLIVGVAAQHKVSQEQAVAIVLSAIQNNPELATAVAQMAEASSDDARGLSKRRKRDLMMLLAGAATGAAVVWGAPKAYNAAKALWAGKPNEKNGSNNDLNEDEELIEIQTNNQILSVDNLEEKEEKKENKNATIEKKEEKSVNEDLNVEKIEAVEETQNEEVLNEEVLNIDDLKKSPLLEGKVEHTQDVAIKNEENHNKKEEPLKEQHVDYDEEINFNDLVHKTNNPQFEQEGENKKIFEEQIPVNKMEENKSAPKFLVNTQLENKNTPTQKSKQKKKQTQKSQPKKKKKKQVQIVPIEKTKISREEFNQLVNKEKKELKHIKGKKGSKQRNAVEGNLLKLYEIVN